jgi:DNA-binding LacI/PurR family transcriptional regulator
MRDEVHDSLSSMPKPAAHKRRRIASSLREMIASLSIGDRLPSVPELERHFGVAKSTVEAAVGELQAEGLIVRRQGAGTFVARSVSTEPEVRPRVGRLAMTSRSLAAPFEVFGEIFGVMAAALESQMRRFGYDPILVLDGDPALRLARVKELWKAGEVDGYIYIGSLFHRDFPAVPGVVMGEMEDASPVHQVVVDNFGGGYRVGEYLWSLGHRRVAFVALHDLGPACPRFQGMRAALRERGASDEDAICVSVSWIGAGPSDLSGLEAALESHLSGANPPTALFFGNDQIALPGLQTLLARGYRIPQDISVVSFDDTPGLASHTRPPLTSMRMPVPSLAALAVQTLHHSLVSSETAFRSLRLPADLIVRDSTGPAPRTGAGRT